MDIARFHHLLRSFFVTASRRGLVAGLASLLTMGSLAHVAKDASAKCRKRCGRCERCKQGTCTPKQDRSACRGSSGRQCCDGRCCPRGNICVSGECVLGRFAVSIVDYAFEPPALEIPAGATVKWTNNGAHSHTATHTPPAGDPSFDSERLLPGEQFGQTFTTAGTFPYDCEVHRGGAHAMNGTVVVT